MWKGRFRVLHKASGTMQYTPAKAAKVTLVCGILHNWLLELGDMGDREMVSEDGGDNDPQGVVGTSRSLRTQGEARRERLLADYLRSRSQPGAVVLRHRE